MRQTFLMLYVSNRVYFSSYEEDHDVRATYANPIGRKTRPEKEKAMQSYENVGGTSAIVAFEIGDDSITVTFVDGSLYLFTYQSAGSANVEQMKKYANFGHGLHGFISRFVGMKSGIKLMRKAV
jgi:hypothetical protein